MELNDNQRQARDELVRKGYHLLNTFKDELHSILELWGSFKHGDTVGLILYTGDGGWDLLIPATPKNSTKATWKALDDHIEDLSKPRIEFLEGLPNVDYVRRYVHYAFVVKIEDKAKLTLTPPVIPQ